MRCDIEGDVARVRDFRMAAAAAASGYKFVFVWV